LIQSFKCKETAKVFEIGFSRKFPVDILKSAIIKLAMLNRSGRIDDLNAPPYDMYWRQNMAFTNELPTIGEVLSTEFLEPMNITQNALAKALGIPQNRLSDIINGKRGVSADTDLRLCKYFGVTDGYFSGIQADFDRIAAKRKILDDLKKIVPLKNVQKAG
jgi:addiction module HigA family antidote